MKRTRVRKHRRSKPSGGVTSVKSHFRNVKRIGGRDFLVTWKGGKLKHLNRENRLKLWKITAEDKHPKTGMGTRTRWEHDDGDGWVDVSYDEYFKTWDVYNQRDKESFETRNEAYTFAYKYRRDYGT